MLPALVMFFRKHFKDFLPGGSMENLVAENVSVAGLPKHNKFCETVFGYFDQLLRTTPALSTLTIEAQTMFVFNKTGEWLAAKDDKERSAIIAQSRKDAGSIKAIYKVSYSGVSIFKTLIPESITLGYHWVTHLNASTVFCFSNFGHPPFLPKARFCP